MGPYFAGPGDAFIPGPVPGEFALSHKCREVLLLFLHGRGLCFRLVLAQSATAGVPSWNLLAVLQLCQSAYTQQNPACHLYLGEDGKQVFGQLSDTHTFTHGPAQSQKLLLLVLRMHTSLSRSQPLPPSCVYLPGVDSPCSNVPSHWRGLHHVKCARSDNRIG